jgi:DNA polymerase III delta prime subunit
MIKDDYLEYRDAIPETILDFKGLRKSIKDFKVDRAVEVLTRYYDDNGLTCNGQQYSRFLPTAAEDIVDSAETGTHNIGIFSTAICLETIAAYAKNINECSIDGKLWVWEESRDRRVPTCESRKVDHERRLLTKPYYGKEKAYAYFKFIIDGLHGDFDVRYGFLAKIATLVRFGNYLNYWEIKEHFISRADESIKNKFHEICSECIVDFQDRFLTKREGIHPFELYRFLQFVRIWGTELSTLLVEPEKVLKSLTQYLTDPKNSKEGAVDFLNKQIKKQTTKMNLFDAVFRYFFDQVYLFAKYELYRQISLKQSGDCRLYDAKRLIYALLIVYLDNRFSNTLIRNKALELIFTPFGEDRNFIWPTGQQVAMSKDGLMIVSDNECVCDLLGSEYLSSTLLDYITELKCIYDGYARTKRSADGKITGWYPVQQRDQTPTSWTSALTLSFIKRFCKLVSLKLAMKAKEKFRSNYRKPDVQWNDIYDSTAAKAKIRLMFPMEYDSRKYAINGQREIIQDCRYRTAILFGPPGTGKTTYGRALATQLKLDYLELTPGDFFSSGEDSILATINDIFEHLLHLRDTVVFIDEIDDLVKDRNPMEKENAPKMDQPYDPRTLFVNSLLPRFQELHDKGNIILLMATNNIERVDEAISRMGRVDLVIPIGAMSPHGRLMFLRKLCSNHQDVLGPLFSLSIEENIDLIVEYLNATEAFNYGALKQYSQMILDEVKKIRGGDVSTIRNKVVKLFEMQAKQKNKGNSLLIWEDDVIRDNHKYDTRPRHQHGDFQDFRHFSEVELCPETKKRFQKEFIRLYINLNMIEIDYKCAEEIQHTISKYSNDNFLMEETQPRKVKQFDGLLFNIMTPFFDDIEHAIDKVKDDDNNTKAMIKLANVGNKELIAKYEEKLAKNKNIMEKLTSSRTQIGRLIFDRSMLPE